MTIAEKRAAVEAALASPEMSCWSDRTIAKKLAVSHTYVSRLRKRVPSSPDATPVTSMVAARQQAKSGAAVQQRIRRAQKPA